MLGYLRRHHVGLIALFVALGGTAYAASKLPDNSVGSRQIRPGAVTGSKLASGSITASKLSPALREQLHGKAPKAQAAWRDPHIAEAIRTASQHVVAQRVVTVSARAPWVSTGLSIAGGEHLWTDTRSDGRWSGNPRLFPYSDANGLPVYPGGYRIYAHANVDSLIAFVGASPPNVPEASIGVGAKPGGPGGIVAAGLFGLGDTKLNVMPTSTGQIWLRNNDNTNYYSDVGSQIVKVIVTS